MLNKEICQKCFYSFGWIFGKSDDMRWEKRILNCPYNFDLVYDEKMPDKCPYALEHLIKNDMQEQKDAT